MGYEQLTAMLANFALLGQCMFLTNQVGKKPLILVYIDEFLDLLIDTETKKWYKNDNDEMQKVQFQFFVIQRLDKFLTMMFKAGNEFENFAAVKTLTAANLKLRSYESATMTIADDLIEVRKWISRNQPCDVPVKIAPASFNKRVKSNPIPQAYQPAPAVAFDKNRNKNPAPAKSSPMNNWGNPGWGAVQPVIKRKGLSPEESAMKGDLLCPPGKADAALEPNLHKKYCAKFNIVGMYCPDIDLCSKKGLKHIPLYRWMADEKEAQIAYVETHRSCVCFSDQAKFLPANKKHLIGHAQGKSN